MELRLNSIHLHKTTPPGSCRAKTPEELAQYGLHAKPRPLSMPGHPDRYEWFLHF